MQYSFLRVFANDSTADAHELAMLERLALKEGIVDDHERSVLSRIFGRMTEGPLPQSPSLTEAGRFFLVPSRG